MTTSTAPSLDQSPAPPAPRCQPATGGWHLAEWASELAGTALLVFAGLSAVVFNFYPGSPAAAAIPSHSLRLLVTGLLFAGAGGLVAISPLGRRSGAHLNPAVTVAFACIDHVHPHDLCGYVGAQFAGALGGATLLRLVWGPKAGAVGYGVTQPGPHTSVAAVFGLEAAMSAALVLTIFAFVSSPRTARWTPAAVWILVAVLVWQAAPVTGTSLNPARSVGPAVVAPNLEDLWIYVLAPVLGAGAAALGWRAVSRRILTAKLFHDPAYRSTLRTALPARPPASTVAASADRRPDKPAARPAS